ncbi:type II secretion system protein [Lachnospira pectinoschiza]|uniref:Prepilin-type N-terminal cleavage/methylation domain-containing protein n=1 Tax=Lachnospira pectinoschiza TaxID=28052 RepID=A0A1G9Z6S1_9FIRM|nr:type II secretion system protein [Lachnospira pectinoschiza]SDN17122.1 prepilin-type N-terminal cleavage/methylation domain-containing protein [Lachnospira pectinoschiza]
MKKMDMKGFSLIELLITLAIMLVLISGSAILMSTLVNANEQRAVNSLKSEVEMLRTNTLSIDNSYYIEITNKEGIIYINSYKNGDLMDSTKLGSRISLSISFTEGDTSTGLTLSKGTSLFIEFDKSKGSVKSLNYGGSAVNSSEDVNGTRVYYITFTGGTNLIENSFINFNIKGRKTKSLLLYLKTGLFKE